MTQFTTLSSRAILLPLDNIDTDQIIPARFLKTTQKTGLGKQLFADWRYHPDGSVQPEFPLNDPTNENSRILVAGDNFGCGSSREHAPWALVDFGFRAIISTSYADIFYNNSLKNGLLPVKVAPSAHKTLRQLLAKQPALTITIDLAAQCVILPDGSKTSFPIDPFSKDCLLKGVDELEYLLSNEARIASYEAAHVFAPVTTWNQTASGASV